MGSISTGIALPGQPGAALAAPGGQAANAAASARAALAVNSCWCGRSITTAMPTTVDSVRDRKSVV